MPFQNLTNDTLWNVWEMGIQNELITQLSNSAELSVSQYQTIQSLLKTEEQSAKVSFAPSIASSLSRKLKANTFIQGSIKKSGNIYRVNAQLIDSETEEIYKTYQIDGDAEQEILDMTDSLSYLILNFLEIMAIKQEAELDYREAFTKSAEAYKNYIQGVNFILNEKYELAIQPLSRALEIDSSFTMASFYMAWAQYYKSNRNLSDVKKWIKIAYLKKHNLPVIYQNWIGIWHSVFVSKNRNELIKYCDLLLQADLKSRIILIDLGLTYKSGLTQYENAVQTFEKIMEINLDWEDNWKHAPFYRGGSILSGPNPYHACGKHDRENEIYEIGLSLFPEDIHIISRQAICALSTEDSTKADNYVTQVTSISKANGWTESQIHHHLGNLYEAAAVFDEAQQHYLLAMRLEPQNLYNIYDYVQMLIVNDLNVDEALRLNQEVLDEFPNNIYHLRLKGFGYCKKSEYDFALRILKDVEEKSPTYDWLLESYILEAEQALAVQNN
jgi:tetratricopeptide (TPR) repeat protein